MRKLLAIIVALAGLGITSVGDVEAQAKIRKICKNIIAVGGPSSTIYKNSAPLRAGGIGTPIVGFRREPTLIFNRRNFSGGSHTVYDRSGNNLGWCPVVSAHGHAGRARCTFQTAGLRQKALRNTRRATVFFKISNNTCVRIPDAGRCYGSVKGLCNQTIG